LDRTATKRRAARPRRAWLALASVLGSVWVSACTREVTLVTRDGVLRAHGARSRFTGLETGAWTFWYPSGEPREEGAYDDDGHRTGTWTQRYPSGQQRSRGERLWNPSTLRSEREGAWFFWHASGMEASRGVYRAGLREGRWEFTNEDGSLDGVQSGEYHADQKLDGTR
jgi:hypothetical protein